MDQRISKLFQEFDELEKEYKKKIMEQLVFQREIPYEYDGIHSWRSYYFLPESYIDNDVTAGPCMFSIQTSDGMFIMPSKQRKELFESVIEYLSRRLARNKLHLEERLKEIERGENDDQN